MDLMSISSIETEEQFYSILEAVQKEYFIILLGGKLFVMKEDAKYGIELIEPQSFKMFLKHLCYNLSITTQNKNTITTKNTTIYIAQEFINSSKTIRIEGIIFDPKLPNGVCGKRYNIWKGFKYEPKKGNVHPFLTLLDINCDGDAEVFDYFIKYIALSVQKPWVNPRTAIAIIGEQGSGKGTLINDTILALSDNSKHLESVDQLIGQFNGNLKDAFYVCLDEATFGGDIKESNKLKTFISEDKRIINEKQKAQYTIDCYSKLFILSNQDYIVNVEQSDRRYIVLRSNNKLKGNFKWFDSYQKWLKTGGYNYIMDYLLNEVDISNFNPLVLPKTKEKTDLQLRSADLPTKFIFDFLAGNIKLEPGVMVGNKIYRPKFYEEFVSYCKRYNPKSYISSTTEFNKIIQKGFNFEKPNWRQNWKDRNGYYYEVESIKELQEKFANNIFKVSADELFFNYTNLVDDSIVFDDDLDIFGEKK